MNTETTNKTKVTIISKPTIHDARFIVLTSNGETVGTLDATFDLSNVPEEYHSFVVQLLLTTRCNITVPTDHTKVGDRTLGGKQGKKPSWWKRLFK